MAILLLAHIEKKPRILIIGDSISLGYMSYVSKDLGNQALIEHNPGNARHTRYGLQEIEEWIGDGEWDIVQFNWGLHDLCYRNPESKNEGYRDRINGKLTTSLEQYSSNLDSIVSIMKSKTSAKLIFVTTTYVPKDESGRFTADAIKYNEAAKKIMSEHSVEINDIYKASIPIHDKYGIGSDDVHYTEKGKEKLGKLITDKLRTALKMMDK